MSKTSRLVEDLRTDTNHLLRTVECLQKDQKALQDEVRDFERSLSDAAVHLRGKLDPLILKADHLQKELKHQTGRINNLYKKGPGDWSDRFAVEVLTGNSLKVLLAANWDDADQRALEAFFDDHKAVVTVHDRLHATSHRATLSISYKERPF